MEVGKVVFNPAPVERRSTTELPEGFGEIPAHLMTDVRDQEIANLRAENARLREALEQCVGALEINWNVRTKAISHGRAALGDCPSTATPEGDS